MLVGAIAVDVDGQVLREIRLPFQHTCVKDVEILYQVFCTPLLFALAVHSVQNIVKNDAEFAKLFKR